MLTQRTCIHLVLASVLISPSLWADQVSEQEQWFNGEASFREQFPPKQQTAETRSAPTQAVMPVAPQDHPAQVSAQTVESGQDQHQQVQQEARLLEYQRQALEAREQALQYREQALQAQEALLKLQQQQAAER
ncbi:hypothetical protein SAMN05421831_103216 [Allopseudospirillum japonicum]|uniref:Uncharacterized protein n=1 Tax=Allopseudospirillum japonicum TaxID=64971 RepID=A0A1H6RM30_9GAMM|nr:hypothetical protein [Allopseudospirillum japonicum]SEI52850.1 hypothetical protein SAMN05421831_103216 [Allopseudospirillum japonicum]